MIEMMVLAAATAGALDWTTGCWTGTGMMQGQPSQVTAQWSAIGYSGAHRQAYRVSWTSAKGKTQTFTGEGSYWAAAVHAGLRHDQTPPKNLV